MDKITTKISRNKKKSRFILGRYPGRTLQRLGAAVTGFWLGGLSLNLFWNEFNESSLYENRSEIKLEDSVYRLKKRIILLAILVDGFNDEPGKSRINEERIKAESTALIQFSPNGDVDILQVPLEIQITLPGDKSLKPLSDMYFKGDVKLMSDILSDLIGLEKGNIDRYIVFSHNSLREFLIGFGSFRIVTRKPSLINDKYSNLPLYLPPGSHVLSGSMLADYSTRIPREFSSEGRSRRKVMVNSLFSKINSAEKEYSYPVLLNNLIRQVKTNLSYEEMVSLLYSISKSNHEPRWETLPLSKQLFKQVRRRLESDSIQPLWPNID
ncbi:hypothetical protein [Prochlorococcus sp. MIT 1341]|uniref:hypothetical protein n=1 Tax=Prochlorococcus sp. MIT 1341 TaxID=3096221 RepID=UPI002A75AF59|nr:hypothetical protein [Prochlorococcus sp. MIT 1341]